ncbi:MAG: hypothetical protein JST76_12590 [Bacteroidetes bacterium]|nr:hypothetical protein [Bacteroidota bacterium]
MTKGTKIAIRLLIAASVALLTFRLMVVIDLRYDLLRFDMYDLYDIIFTSVWWGIILAGYIFMFSALYLIFVFIRSAVRRLRQSE